MDKNGLMYPIVSVDIGLKHTGVALSRGVDDYLPVTVIHHRSIHSLKDALTKIVKEYTPATILVGDMGGEMPAQYHTMITSLSNDPRPTVVLWSEYLTSFQGGRGSSSSYHGKSDHTQAAIEILRDYIIEATD